MADFEYLESFASEARKNCLFCIANLGVGHVGGSLSIIEILTYLLNGEMRNLYPDDPGREDRDMLVVSKGHSGPALYSILAKKGYFPMSWLNTLNQGGTRLPSHCDRNQTPGIDMSTGSLGQGISAACGIAYASKLKGTDQRTYCIIGDGETEEGQNWEAAMFARAKGLDNLIVITDYNKLQLDGPVAQVLSLDDLETKWKAFGWDVVRCNGHDLRDLDRAFGQCHERDSRPKMVICDTVKAKGFPRLENKPESHNANITLDEVKALYNNDVPSWLGDKKDRPEPLKVNKPALPGPASSCISDTSVEMRQAYCQTLMDIAEKDPRLVILEADLMKSSGTVPFMNRFGARAIDCGIAEANMVGIASGLSVQGFIPFAATFACFAGRRTFDQFFISSNYARLNVKLVGTDPGIAAVYNGGTHMPFEDIGLMRMIPDLVIAEPSDAASVSGLVRAMYEYQGSCYLRLQRKDSPAIYGNDEKFELGRSKVLAEGSDVTLIGLGAVMMQEVLKAAAMLEKDGIHVTVIDALTVKPLDRDLILAKARETKAIVTCENHQVDGGLGMAVTKLLADENVPCRMGYIGIQGRFGQVGNLDYLIHEYNLSASDICARAKTIIEKK